MIKSIRRQHNVIWTSICHFTLFVIFWRVMWSLARSSKKDDLGSSYYSKFDVHFNEGNSNVSTLVSRPKRQWGCPTHCFSPPCVNTAQCQRYQLATVCVLGCCCPASPVQTNLSSACDGDPAVAACLNGLCGQGYFCNARNFCCRCQSGTSPGPCVNSLCPPGYACNTNNFCCSLGSGSLLQQCVNNQCLPGFVCGAGNLCYPLNPQGNQG